MTSFDLVSMIFAGCLMIISGAFLERLWFAKKHFRLRQAYDNYLKFEDLPTVSVCIPARNEKQAIEACLERVLASDYPKMEVIVLDDDSVDNTSEVVKKFAQRGVRFIKGQKLPKGWVGKNHAMAQLTAQATGSYIIFMSVDTIVSETDFGTMIRYALDKNLAMLSVMPRRSQLRPNVFFGSLRFFWELILHSRNFPATSTSIWLVKVDELNQYGDFWEHHRATVRPESALAGYFYGKHRYHFLVANQFLNISHEKDWRSQLTTTIRTIGPVFDKSIWLKANVLVVLIIITNGALVCAINLLLTKIWWVGAVNLAGLLTLSLLSVCYTEMSWARGQLLGLVSWPWAFLQELWLLFSSIIYNKFQLVSWKGRRLPSSK